MWFVNQVNQVSQVNQAFLFSEKIKKPAASYSRTGESRTTLGDGALDFRVRNGNGYDNSSMATGKREITEFRITNCEYSVESQPKLGTKENYDSSRDARDDLTFK